MSVRKFSPEQVERIRERAAAGELKKVVAFDYGAAIETIRDITTGVTYRDCNGPITSCRNAVTDRERAKVIALLKKGVPINAIGRAVSRHHGTVRKIRNQITNRSGAEK
jgi:DNA-binding NarL/FixJ family response regulator